MKRLTCLLTTNKVNVLVNFPPCDYLICDAFFFLIFFDAVDHCSSGSRISQTAVDTSTTCITCYLAHPPPTPKKEIHENKKKTWPCWVSERPLCPLNSSLHLCTFHAEHFSILGPRGWHRTHRNSKGTGSLFYLRSEISRWICLYCAIECVHLPQFVHSRCACGGKMKYVDI